MVIDIGIGIDLAKIIILPYEFFFLEKDRTFLFFVEVSYPSSV